MHIKPEGEPMNQRYVILSTSLTLLLFGAILLLADRVADAQQPVIGRKALLKQDSTIPGYELIMNIVEIPAGVSEVRHTHPGPLAGYILEGTLVLEHEGRPTATYKAGERVLITMEVRMKHSPKPHT
jgi:quercetin dioxygenase-like cupin family protein